MTGPERIAAALNGQTISDETFSRLGQFVALVQKWNPTINVIAKSTVGDIWTRHILDSVQAFTIVRPGDKSWVDMGSGGGFPGMVIAILAAELAKDLVVTLIESDKRKSVFLAEVARNLGLKVNISVSRIESAPPMSANIVSARALAPLSTLFDFAARHLAPDGVSVFLKGANSEREIEEAKRLWQFEFDAVKSVTDDAASMIVVRNLRSV